MRKCRCFVWADPNDCLPPHSLDLSSEHDARKVEDLCLAFLSAGFDLNMPALVGYPIDGKIQLLSGTHRHLAAIQAGIKIPVTLWLRSNVESLWGTELWPDLIKDIPVNELEEFSVEDGIKDLPYDKVNLLDLDGVE